MTALRQSRRIAMWPLLAAAVTGCSVLPAPTPIDPANLPPGVEVTSAPDAMRLEMTNDTTIPVVLTVNGGVGRRFDPGGGANLGIAEIGPPPWKATVRTIGGRILLRLDVNPGDVAVGRSSSRGKGARADLSCGRIDLWSGPPMLGPAPGPGTPGDCD